MNEQELKREIGLFQATMMVVGVVIGSGVFFKPSSVFGGTMAPGLGLLAWVVGGIIAVSGALSIAELASAIPETGGLMIYLNKLFGEKIGFLFGWTQILIYFPAMDAALSVAFASQFTSFIDVGSAGQKIISIIVLILLGLINLLSAKNGAKFNTIATVAKLVPITAVIVGGIVLGKTHTFSPVVSESSTSSGFGAAMLGVLFAFEGWISICNLGGEIKDAQKNFPKAIIFGMIIITVAYLGVNVAVLNTMTMEEIISSPKVVSDVAEILFGSFGGKLIAIGILVSIFGCLIPFLLSGARLPYSLAKDDKFIFNEFFSKLNKNGTPANAILVQLVLAVFYIMTGTFDTLTNLLVFVTWMFIFLGIIGVFVLRKNHEELLKEGNYKVPLFPIVPIIGAAGALYICINTFINTTGYAIYGLIVTLVGLPVYMFIEKRSKRYAK